MNTTCIVYTDDDDNFAILNKKNKWGTHNLVMILDNYTIYGTPNVLEELLTNRKKYGYYCLVNVFNFFENHYYDREYLSKRLCHLKPELYMMFRHQTVYPLYSQLDLGYFWCQDKIYHASTEEKKRAIMRNLFLQEMKKEGTKHFSDITVRNQKIEGEYVHLSAGAQFNYCTFKNCEIDMFEDANVFYCQLDNCSLTNHN